MAATTSGKAYVGAQPSRLPQPAGVADLDCAVARPGQRRIAVRYPDPSPRPAAAKAAAAKSRTERASPVDTT